MRKLNQASLIRGVKLLQDIVIRRITNILVQYLPGYIYLPWYLRHIW